MADTRKVRTLTRLSDGRIKRVWDPLATQVLKRGGYVDYDSLKKLKSRSFSFIIPYMYSLEREGLFLASLKSLTEHIGNRDMEVCVHEIGPEQTLPNWNVKNYKYLFTKYEGIFHRAWAMNVAAKHIATKEIFVLLDADLLYTEDWFEEILTCNLPAIAWGKMYFLNEESTNLYIEKNIFKPVMWEGRKIRKPRIGGAAGGASFVPRKIFFEVRGIPEDFGGTWGGEDNAFMAKISKYGYPLWKFKSTLYHMYHEHKTIRDMNILPQAQKMLKWSKKDWITHTENIKQWGRRDDPKMYLCAQLSG